MEVASDFIIPPDISELVNNLPKKKRKEPPPADENADQKRDRLAKEELDLKADAKKVRDKDEKNLNDIGRTYLSYLKNGQASRLTNEDIKQRLRRGGMDPARKVLEDRIFDVALDADLSYPTHILAHRVNAENGVYDAVRVDQAIEEVKDQGKDSLVVRLMKQKLQTIFANYKRFTSEEQSRSLDDFKAYLKRKAQPAVAAAVGGTIKVNMGGNVLFACFAKADPNIGIQTSVYGITAGGEIKAFTPEEVRGVFQ